MNCKWNILNKSKTIPNILENIRDWKQIPKGKMQEFINFNMEPYSPYALTNMDKAVVKIREAINNNNKICIIGDYDVDG